MSLSFRIWLVNNGPRQHWQHAMGWRLLLSAALSWWLLAPFSALLALTLRQFNPASEAVVLAGFFAPLLLLGWWFISFFLRRALTFSGYLLGSAALIQAAGWWWL